MCVKLGINILLVSMFFCVCDIFGILYYYWFVFVDVNEVLYICIFWYLFFELIRKFGMNFFELIREFSKYKIKVIIVLIIN